VPVHWERAVESLKRQVLSLGGHVEESLRLAVRAFLEGDVETARRLIAGDDDLDLREVEIEEECLKLLALYHPVAGDMRFVVAILKLNNDLERIGDLAVNIAELTLEWDRPAGGHSMELARMAEQTQTLLKKALDALVNRNAILAHEVRQADDAIDAYQQRAEERLHQAVREGRAEQVERLVAEWNAAHQLERVADHATNIAEDVIYLVEGRIVRHHPESEQ
jgi:phosphate transport system protein